MLKVFNNEIAIDKDDTLNYLTYALCQQAGIDTVPSLDEIKDNKASPAFYEARKTFFADPSVFSSAPYGGARTIVDKAKDNGFKPKICTKTMTTHPRADEITAHKMKFWQEHFSDIEMQIVTGVKSTDAIALIDDSAKNCLDFNSRNFRNFLIWSHRYDETTYNAVLDSFYSLNKKLYENQTVEMFNKKGALYINFKGTHFDLEMIVPSERQKEEYKLFSTQFNSSNKLIDIYYKGNLDKDIDLLEMVKASCLKYRVDYDFYLVLTYNLANALKI
jgi:hypothetical protein